MRTVLFMAVFAAAMGRGGCDPVDYDPCAGKACGEYCRICPPDDADCVETAIVKVCDGAGQCGGAVACEPPPDPCAGKRCGEGCTTCTGPVCPAVMEYCDAAGDCGTTLPECAAPPYDPCTGKACGESCNPCDPPCMTFAATACDAKGECVTVGTFTCEPPPPDPCAGKGCGDACSTCPPGALCPAVMMYCDARGACGFAYPACTTATP